MRDVNKVEDDHEEERSELKVMDLPGQPSGSVQVVVQNIVGDDGDDDDVDGLRDVRFVHHRHDIDGLRVVLLQQHCLQQHIPDYAVE